MGLDRIVRARTGNRKSQHKASDPTRKPPECLPPPILTELPPKTTARSRDPFPAHRPLKGPSRRNFPKMTAKPNSCLETPSPCSPAFDSFSFTVLGWVTLELELQGPQSPYVTLATPTYGPGSSLVSYLIQVSSTQQACSSVRPGLRDEM